MIKDVKKILIFKLCCLGDSVFITPAIISLRKNFPDAKIVYAYAEWITQMMSYLPEVDGSILFENVYSKNIFKKFYGAMKFILKIRKEKFDLVFYGHRSNLLSFILFLCSVKFRVGFSGTRFLTHTGCFDKNLPEYKRYSIILKENNLNVIETLPFLKKPNVKKLRAKFGLLEDEKLLGIYSQGGINPGTSMYIKKWDLKNYFILTKLINEAIPEVKVIHFEGRSKNEKIDIPEHLRSIKKTISNELIACCDYFLSIDTGSLHIAAAFGIPTISIFGPSDPGLLSPANPPGKGNFHRVIWKKPVCSPCYTPNTAIDFSNRKYWKGKEFICYIGSHECMKSILPIEVFNELMDLMKNNI